MSNLQNLSVSALKRAIVLREKIDALNARLSELLEEGGISAPFSATPVKRHMSASARRRIGAAQKLRWARQKGEITGVAAAKPGRKKFSKAARMKMAAAAKERWAKAKAAGRKTL